MHGALLDPDDGSRQRAESASVVELRADYAKARLVKRLAIAGGDQQVKVVGASYENRLKLPWHTVSAVEGKTAPGWVVQSSVRFEMEHGQYHDRLRLERHGVLVPVWIVVLANKPDQQRGRLADRRGPVDG